MTRDDVWQVYLSKQDAADLRERLSSGARHEVRQPLIPVRKQVEPWQVPTSVSSYITSQNRWIAQRSREALFALNRCVDINPRILGGVPVLHGTRFSISQLFAELADSDAVVEIADDLELDPNLINTFLHAFAVYLDKPAVWKEQ